MNGLIKTSKLEGLNFLGSFVIALTSVALAVYVIANGFGGGIA